MGKNDKPQIIVEEEKLVDDEKEVGNQIKEEDTGEEGSQRGL